jgi:hypothetical protein
MYWIFPGLTLDNRVFFDDVGELVRFYCSVPYAVEGDRRHYLQLEEPKASYRIVGFIPFF